MAAAPGPREEAEERRRLLRAVTRLQAGVRGFLLRRRLRSVRAEYEEVVREIEGDLSELQWRGLCLPRPVFVPKLMLLYSTCSHPEKGLGQSSQWFKPERGRHCGRAAEANEREVLSNARSCIK